MSPKAPKKKYPKIELRWTDSFAPGDIWTNIELVKKCAEEHVTMRSRGYLVYEDDQWLGISHSLQDSFGEPIFAGGLMMIPKVCVLYRKER